MNSTRLTLLFSLIVFVTFTGISQNVSLNLLTQNSGIVNVGGTVSLEVTVCNTDGAATVPVYKLRPQISVPGAIASIPTSGHSLPSGWNIVSNTGTVIRLTNGTDQVPANTCRTILLQVQGNTIGGPSTISGNLLFSNGSAPGSASGSATAGDNPSDNSSTSTVQVTTVTPVKLTGFNASVTQCRPVLNWSTEYEINSYSFEIQRSRSNELIRWEGVGSLAASRNTYTRKSYSYTDNSHFSGKEKMLYRLKMIDRDGKFTYSEVLPVVLNCNARFMNVFPNPVNNGRLIITLGGTDQGTEVQLLSTQGQVLRRITMRDGTSGMDVAGLASGTYFLQVKFSDGGSSRKAVIIGQ